MEPNEKTILKRQYAAFFAALMLFIPSIFLFATVFHSMKLGMLVPLTILSYVCISSIKNRVSIIRPKGRMEYSKGKQAVFYGVILLIGAVANIIFILTPFSDMLNTLLAF